MKTLKQDVINSDRLLTARSSCQTISGKTREEIETSLTHMTSDHDFILLIGPSGAGKSHLCSIMDGFHFDTISKQVDQKFWITQISLIEPSLFHKGGVYRWGDVCCHNLVQVLLELKRIFSNPMVIFVQPSYDGWRKTCKLKAEGNIPLPNPWRQTFYKKSMISFDDYEDYMANHVLEAVVFAKEVGVDFGIYVNQYDNPTQGWAENKQF